MNLKQLIKQSKFDYVNSNITETNFSKPSEVSDKVEVMSFEKEMTSKEVLAYFKENNLRPANSWELVQYAKDRKDIDYIVALGDTWQDPDRNLCVLVLGCGDRNRDLFLNYFGGGWARRCRFAFVCKSLETSDIQSSLTLEPSESLYCECERCKQCNKLIKI